MTAKSTALKPHVLFAAVSVTASALILWLYIITQITPNPHDIALMAAFFLSLFTWIAATIAIALYIYRVRAGNREIIYAHVPTSIRQGVLISLTVITLLFLQFLRVLSGIDVFIIIGVAVLYELAARRQTSPH